jgi:2,4-dienoyl-CoA reductase-like NADH-dependent reductase (Old Yellow Enzyme family)
MTTNLLSTLKLKEKQVKNRIVLPPLASRGATKEGEVTEKVLKQYAERPGVGIIISEHSYVSAEGRVSQNQLGIYDDKLIPGLKKLVKTIKSNGSLAGIQITHGGSAVASEINGRKALAPSAVPHPGRDIGETPVAFSKKQLAALKDSFVKGALRAQKAGFDFIELHGAHGYLLNQFLSPLTNKREDEYGGSFAARLRFPLEIVKAVREAVGQRYPIFYRLGCDDFLEGGLVVEDGVKAAPQLEDAGVDLLDLSGGLKGYGPAEKKSDKEEGHFVYLGEAIKPVVNIPILVTGGIKTSGFADRIVRNNKTDLVGVGRAMLKDKEWAKKALNKIN